MWDMKPPKVLVGVDRPDCEAALQYAVAEARRRGCGIHLVHVARPILASRALDDIALVDGELRETSRVLLARAAARTQQLIDAQDPDDERLSVSTEVTHGSVVAMLHSLSAHAALLVMEHQGMGRHGETPTLSVTAGVAAVAQCPVVAVPDSWRPTAGIGGAVVVGISDPERDRAVVEEARNEAERRRTDLVVVGPATDPMLAEELLRHASAAELLVVARHWRKHSIGAPLGRTARELLRHGAVPVLVVDPAARKRRPSADRGPSPSEKYALATLPREDQGP